MHSSPVQVPSAYYLTDVYVYLDALCNFKLFKPDAEKHESKLALAARAGLMSKKCIGALRYLWRSSNTGGHDPRVKELKQLLMPSPPRNRRALEADATWLTVHAFDNVDYIILYIFIICLP